MSAGGDASPNHVVAAAALARAACQREDFNARLAGAEALAAVANAAADSQAAASARSGVGASPGDFGAPPAFFGEVPFTGTTGGPFAFGSGLGGFASPQHAGAETPRVLAAVAAHRAECVAALESLKHDRIPGVRKAARGALELFRGLPTGAPSDRLGAGGEYGLGAGGGGGEGDAGPGARPQWGAGGAAEGGAAERGGRKARPKNAAWPNVERPAPRPLPDQYAPPQQKRQPQRPASAPLQPQPQQPQQPPRKPFLQRAQPEPAPPVKRPQSAGGDRRGSGTGSTGAPAAGGPHLPFGEAPFSFAPHGGEDSESAVSSGDGGAGGPGVEIFVQGKGRWDGQADWAAPPAARAAQHAAAEEQQRQRGYYPSGPAHASPPGSPNTRGFPRATAAPPAATSPAGSPQKAVRPGSPASLPRPASSTAASAAAAAAAAAAEDRVSEIRAREEEQVESARARHRARAANTEGELFLLEEEIDRLEARRAELRASLASIHQARSACALVISRLFSPRRPHTSSHTTTAKICSE